MAAESPVANRPPIFYGWWIVAVCLVHMALASGICNLAFPVFFVPFADEFGWTRTAIAGGISITLLTIGLTAPFAGRLTDRYGPRRVMIPATLLSALLLLALSRFNALWQLYALRALLGVTFACMAHLPVNVILAHWFDRYRGRATGIALLGPALGGLLFTPLLSLLVETVGWRTGLLCSAVLMALSLPLLVFAMRDTPQQSGLHPDGAAANADGTPRPSHIVGPTPAQVVRTRRFWFLLSVYFFLLFGTFSMFTHQLPYFIDAGHSLQDASLMVSAILICSLIAGVLCGWASEHVDAYGLAASVCGCGAVALIILLGNPTGLSTVIYVVLFGIAYGGVSIMMVMVVSRSFGTRAFGVIYGYFQTTICFAGFLGPVAIGLIYDTFQGYRNGFILITAIWIACVVCLLGLSRVAPLAKQRTTL